MKILFLDIDGVLNSTQSSEYWYWKNLEDDHPVAQRAWLDENYRRAYGEEDFCPIACSNLKKIMREIQDLQIVMSSSWRLGNDLEQVRDIIEFIGIDRSRVIDKTPYLPGKIRGEEIQKWIDDYCGSTMLMPFFVIVDDESDMGNLTPHLVKTDYHHGLMHKDAETIISFFRNI